MEIRTQKAVEAAVARGNFTTDNPQNHEMLKGMFYSSYRRNMFPGPNGIGFDTEEHEFDIQVEGVGHVRVLTVGIGPGVDAVGGCRVFRDWSWKWTIA